MTSTARERVRVALSHRPPDVTPWQIDLTSDARRNLSAYLGVDDLDPILQNHLAICEDGHFVQVAPDHWRDQFGVVWNRTIDKDIGNVERYLLPEPTLAGYRFPAPDAARNGQTIEALLAKYPDRFRVAGVGFSMFERAWTLRGMEDLLIDMVLNPGFVDDLMDRILEYNLQAIEHMLHYDVDCIRFGDDWGQQRGLIMGPKHWRRFIKPRVAQMYARVKAAGRSVMQHSCGAVQELFPDLVEMGLDVFNTFQPEVMDVEWCKREFGRYLTFYGGISTQQVLPRVGPGEVRADVRRMIDTIGREGGYIVAPTHAIPRDVPPQNIVAMLDVVQGQ